MQSSNNTPSFGAKIRLKNPEFIDAIANMEHTKFVDEALDSFLVHEPRQTVEINRVIFGDLCDYYAENVNNGETFSLCFNYDTLKLAKEEAVHFCEFLKSLMNNVSFWKDTKLPTKQILNHNVFELV